MCLCPTNITQQQNTTQRVDQVLNTNPSNLSASLRMYQHPLPPQLRRLLNKEKHFILFTLLVSKRDLMYLCACVAATLHLNKIKHRKSIRYWTLTLPILLPPTSPWSTPNNNKNHISLTPLVHKHDSMYLSELDHITLQLNTAHKLEKNYLLTSQVS